jgi:hypothetical protein
MEGREHLISRVVARFSRMTLVSLVKDKAIHVPGREGP